MYIFALSNKIKFINHLNAITNMVSEYQFNSQEVCIFPKENGLYIISVIRYYYTRKDHSDPKLTSESNWRWETNIVRNSYSNFNLITLERRLLLNS